MRNTTAKGAGYTCPPANTPAPCGRPAWGGQILIRMRLGEHRMREGRGRLGDSRASGHQSKLDLPPGCPRMILARTASSFFCPVLLQLPSPSSDGHGLSLETLLHSSPAPAGLRALLGPCLNSQGGRSSLLIPLLPWTAAACLGDSQSGADHF